MSSHHVKGRRTQFRRPLSFFFIPKGSKALPPLFQPRCCGSPALRPCLPPGGVSAAFRRFSRTRPAAFQDNGPVGRQRYEKAGSCTTRPPKSAESRLPGEEAGRLRRREKRRTRQRTVPALRRRACPGARAERCTPRPDRRHCYTANFSRWTLSASACSSQLANPACCRASNTVASQSQDA